MVFRAKPTPIDILKGQALVLIAQHLHYAYPEAGQTHTVLNDVNLSLAAGEQLALVGSSGSGKSTLHIALAQAISANLSEVMEI